MWLTRVHVGDETFEVLVEIDDDGPDPLAVDESRTAGASKDVVHLLNLTASVGLLQVGIQFLVLGLRNVSVLNKSVQLNWRTLGSCKRLW